MSNANVVKHCHVCGDVAHPRGFNFSGFSCEMTSPAVEKQIIENEPIKNLINSFNNNNNKNCPNDAFRLQTYDNERLREIYQCKKGWPDETVRQAEPSREFEKDMSLTVTGREPAHHTTTTSNAHM